MKKIIKKITVINNIFLMTLLVTFFAWNIWATATGNNIWVYEHPGVGIPLLIIFLLSTFFCPILNRTFEFNQKLELDELKFKIKILKALKKA